MAGQRYCDGVSWEKSFQDAVRQTGANGLTSLKLVGESIGRGPVGSLVGVAKTTAKAIIEAEKESKANRERNNKPAPKKAVQKPIPKKIVHKPTPKRVAHKPTPKKVAHKPTQKKVVHKSTPKKVTHRPTPRRIAHKPAHKRIVHKPAPKRAVHKPVHKKAAHKPSPKKAIHKPTPKRVAHKPKNGGKKLKKRELAGGDVILNQRDFEIVERDEDFNLGGHFFLYVRPIKIERLY